MEGLWAILAPETGDVSMTSDGPTAKRREARWHGWVIGSLEGQGRRFAEGAEQLVDEVERADGAPSLSVLEDEFRRLKEQAAELRDRAKQGPRGAAQQRSAWIQASLEEVERWLRAIGSDRGVAAQRAHLADRLRRIKREIEDVADELSQ